MEEQKECDSKENHIHSFYFVKIRPSSRDVKISEAEKQLSLAHSHIYDEIAKQKALEHKLNEEVTRVDRLEEYIQSNLRHIKYVEQLYKWVHSPDNSVEKTTNGFFQLYVKDKNKKVVQTHIRVDRKRVQNKLFNKGVMDVEFLEQVQEELIASKQSGGITSSGKRELHDLVTSVAHRIQHGNEKCTHELKIYQEIKTVKETRELYFAPEVSPRSTKQWFLKLQDHDSNWKISKQNQINFCLEENEKLEWRIGSKSGAQLKANLENVRKNISYLNKKLENVTAKMDKDHKHLEDQTKEMKLCYDEYQSEISYAKQLARRGDVVRLKKLCDSQVDKFMKQWSENKGFRDDYEKRKLPLKRQ